MPGADRAGPGAGPAWQPGAGSLLLSAWKLAVQIDELQRMGPAAAACAENAWLGGDHGRVHDVAAPVYQEARRLDDRVHQAELGYWLAKAGQRVQPEGDHPYAVQAAGRWREAAALWGGRGMPVRARRGAGGKPRQAAAADGA